MRFGIVHRTVSYIGLRQISCDVTLLAKAPLGKGPRPPPASWKAQKSSKKAVDREVKNRYKTPEQLKGEKSKKYLVAVLALGLVLFVSQPLTTPSTGRVSLLYVAAPSLIEYFRLTPVLE